MKVKVCGIRSLEGAKACREAEADFVGLNFVPSSRRRVSIDQARILLDEISVSRVVGVFFNQEFEEIEAIADALGITMVQLHGQESPDLCRVLSKKYRLIKAIAVDESFEEKILEPYREWVEYFLFDAPKAGSGKPFDWEKLKSIDRKTPFFLAGGLEPENVRMAIERVRPDGVDTASGIEKEKIEDRERILAFCANARR